MDEFERKHMERLIDLGINAWMRYVDDVFATIRNKERAHVILEYLNSQHPNIKFTMELANNHKLPFLDTCVVRKERGYTTTIYRKKTFTGVYLNWTSLTARKYKISLIYSLCNRIWRICQEEQDRTDEFKKLRQILLKNEYPEKVIDEEIGKFVRRKTKEIAEQQQPQPNTQQESDQPQPQQPQPQPQQQQPEQTEIRKKYIVLPYTDQKGEDFADRLTRLVNKTFPKVDLKVAFRAPNEIGKMFPFKDKIKDPLMQSMVVYRITCNTCNQQYIGKTIRFLKTRVKEHNNPKGESAIQAHKKEFPGHDIDATTIEVIDRADTNLKLMVKEMLHINHSRPALNTQHAAHYKKMNNKDMFKTQLNTVIIARKA
jgi:hypothetical protein